MALQIKKLLYITIAWTLVSVYEYFYTYSVLLSTEYSGDKYQFDVGSFISIGLLPGILAGIIGGSLLLLLWSKWLREMKYGYALLSIFLTYSILFLFIYGAASVFYGYYRSSNIASEVSLSEAVNFYFWNVSGIVSYFTWMGVVILTLIFMQVSDKYGPGIFTAMLKGEYFQPKRQTRIFMFLDLNSSTQIAEILGEFTYFNFLKDTIKTITPAILNYQGEIYQYVGDEVVISWKVEGVKNTVNCLLCFLEIERKLKEMAPFFEGNYGIQPVFKAGIHYGTVMTGEIGVVKREIAHSGDVLNTAARIRSKCTELRVNLLFSEHLLKTLRASPDQFNIVKMGSIPLRGKRNPLNLYSLAGISKMESINPSTATVIRIQNQ
jgi:adenylate cyclase